MNKENEINISYITNVTTLCSVFFFLLGFLIIENRLRRKVKQEMKKGKYTMSEEAENLTHQMEKLFLEYENNVTSPENFYMVMQSYLDSFYLLEETLNRLTRLMKDFDDGFTMDKNEVPRTQDQYIRRKSELFSFIRSTIISDPDGNIVLYFESIVNNYSIVYLTHITNIYNKKLKSINYLLRPI